MIQVGSFVKGKNINGDFRYGEVVYVLKIGYLVRLLSSYNYDGSPLTHETAPDYLKHFITPGYKYGFVLRNSAIELKHPKNIEVGDMVSVVVNGGDSISTYRKVLGVGQTTIRLHPNLLYSFSKIIPPPIADKQVTPKKMLFKKFKNRQEKLAFVYAVSRKRTAKQVCKILNDEYGLDHTVTTIYSMNREYKMRTQPQPVSDKENMSQHITVSDKRQVIKKNIANFIRKEYGLRDEVNLNVSITIG